MTTQARGGEQATSGDGEGVATPEVLQEPVHMLASTVQELAAATATLEELVVKE